MFKSIYKKGIEEGVRQMKEKVMECSESKKPILITDRVYLVQTDIEHLRELMNNC